MVPADQTIGYNDDEPSVFDYLGALTQSKIISRYYFQKGGTQKTN
jgi:hypothetical protein